MTPEQDKQLVAEFPNLYADRYANMQDTCMCWGFEVGSGWFEIIYNLSKQLEPLIVQYKQENPEQADYSPRASQVKEKYGTLRFYMMSETEPMRKFISEAEDLSEVTCEQCGQPGRLRGRRWYYTACDSHTKKEDLDVEKENS